MDLLLELRCRHGGAVTSADVVVDIDPDDTVHALTQALAEYANRHSPAPLPANVVLIRGVAGASPRPGDPGLDPTARIVDSGLVSGETVLLTTPQRPEAVHPDLNLSLDIASGPQSGRSVPLTPGRHTVGGGVGCEVVVGDPLLAREHFTIEVTAQGELRVAPNPAAETGTRVGGMLLDGPEFVMPGEEIQAGATMFVVRRVFPDETRRRDRLGQIPFNRVPYRRAMVPKEEFETLPAPPTAPDKRPLTMMTVLTPAMSSLPMAIMFHNQLFLLVALATPLLYVFNHFSERRGGRKKYLRDRTAFFDKIESRAAEIDEALVRERQTRLEAAPDLADLGHQASFHMPRLWERNRSAGDLLQLRLGLGDQPSLIRQQLQRTGDEELQAHAERMVAHHASVFDVPVTVNLVDDGTMGLCGDPMQVAATARSLITQAACLHSPEDLVIAAALSPGKVASFDWLKWLPHVRSATSPLDGDHVVVGAAEARRLLVNLLAVVGNRAERKKSVHSGEQPVWPRVLVVMDEGVEADRSLLSQLLDTAPDFGIHLMWLGSSELQVPRQCKAVVRCAGVGQASVVRSTDPAVADQVVEPDGAGPVAVRTVARALAPLRDASAGSATTAIPRIVPLLDVVGLDRPDATSIVERWNTPRPYSLEFAIGQSVEGTFALDLVEQGPHTLIGGTSGAGKSELLQTLVLSLAANYSPTMLNFLFVDYKGGASSAEFRDLPHTVGYVTNLSGRLSMRALTSLRAELQRRMLLMEGRAKDLREMLEIAPDEAPPSLVIVVDEFAALVKEIPDFVAGMVDIAQRGRSLGIHLVLATQRPTGVVNDNILANTNLRIALRMLDSGDSDNIINSREAADIPVPLRGRAYARTGPQTLVPFQCAWSGAPYQVAGAGDQRRIVDVRPFVLHPDLAVAMAGSAGAGGFEPEPSAAAAGGGDEPETHLEVLVRACADANERLGLPPVRRPWVEPLADVVPLDDVLAELPPGELRRDPGRYAVLGRYDDPENQAQHPSLVDLETAGGLLVYGTGGAGKTTLLRTLALGMAAQGDADQVVLYALDYASRSLDPLGDLPQCGGVFQADDNEGVTRLLTVLEREIESRRRALAAERAESLGALRARTGEIHFPRIVVLVDGFGTFHEMFDKPELYQWQTAFQLIVTAGRQVGIHCILTNDRRMGVPAALQSAISARLVLRMSSVDEMASLNVPSAVAKDADLPNGRGFASWLGGGTTEVQVACPGHDPSGLAQVETLVAQAEVLRSQSPARAPELPELPEHFVVETEQVGPPLTATLGIADMTAELVEVDLSRQNLVVLGPPRSGKSAALATIAQGIRASTGDKVRLLGMGSASSPLADLDLWDVAAFSRASIPVLGEKLWDKVAGMETVDVKYVLFIDPAEDLDDYDIERSLENIVKRECVRLVVACDGDLLAKAYSGWMSTLRRNRTAIMLQPESRVEVDSVLDIKVFFRPGQTFPPGRGIVVANRQWQLVQVAYPGGG